MDQDMQTVLDNAPAHVATAIGQIVPGDLSTTETARRAIASWADCLAGRDRPPRSNPQRQYLIEAAQGVHDRLAAFWIDSERSVS